MSATLPVVAQITGTLLFPAVRTPATISLSGSATAPAGVASESPRGRTAANPRNGTVTTYNPDGSSNTPTVTAGVSEPQAIAVDAAGNYVKNQGNYTGLDGLLDDVQSGGQAALVATKTP